MTSNTYSIKYSNRKTLALTVDDDNNIKVRAPYRTSGGEIRRFVIGNRDWIEKRTLDNKKRSKVLISFLSQGHNLEKRKEHAFEVISSKVEKLAKTIDVRYKKFRLSNARKRWGSCSTKGTVSINWKLVFAPKEVLEYVVIHELIHLKHMNHSKDFWRELERHVPKHKEKRAWLKKNEFLLKL